MLILRPLILSLPSCAINNTDLLQKLADGISLEPNMFLASIDVEALTISISHNKDWKSSDIFSIKSFST